MMPGNIAVVYEQGVLRPLQPLNLPERTHLEIRIVATAEETVTDTHKDYRALVETGLVQPLAPMGLETVSETERLQAADEYGLSGSLSEWVSAGRDKA